MGYKGRLVLLVIILMISAEFTTYDYINDLPAVKWDLLGAIIISFIGWWLGKNYDRTNYYAQRDILTGTYNRVFFVQMFSKLIRKFERTNEQLAVVLVDVNNLKKTNDLYGHLVGDDVIKHVAHTLLSCIRKNDFVTRWGGDEFVIVASGTEAACSLLKKIEENMLFIKIRDHQHIKPSVSIGVAVYPVDGKTFDDLIRVADVRMYEDKKGKERP